MRKLKAVGALVLGCMLVMTLESCTGKREVGPPKENVFRLAIRSKFTTLDPHFMTDIYSIAAAGLVVENLYDFHYLKRPRQLEPLLADGMPTMSKDFKTFTFKIKKGIKYQDHPCFKSTNGKGPELTAHDFAYAIHRMSSPKKASPQYSNFEGTVMGVDEYHSGKAPSIKGVRVVDSHTLEIKLAKARPRFAFTFTGPRTGPLPQDCVENLNGELTNTVVGTGAYKIVEYDPNSKLIAVKNTEYKTVNYPTVGNPGDKEKGLLEDAGKPLPFVDKVVYDVLVEDQPRWLKFMAGEHEVVRIPKDNIGTALENGKISPELAKRGVQHVREAEADVTTWIFNMKTPVWGEKKELRQAFSLSIDRPRLIELNYGGQAVAAQSLIDPTMYGYDANWKNPYTTRDVKKAKELIAKAGYPDGKGLPELEMPISASSVGRQIGEATQRFAADVGIKMKLIPMAWPELAKGLRESKWMITGLGYGGAEPDVDGVLPHFHSRNMAPGPNVANYKNVELDKLTDEINTMANSPARMAKIVRVREIMAEDMPYIPGVHRIGNHLVQPWVKNYVYVDEQAFGEWMKYMRVVPATAEKK